MANISIINSYTDKSDSKLIYFSPINITQSNIFIQDILTYNRFNIISNKYSLSSDYYSIDIGLPNNKRRCILSSLIPSNIYSNTVTTNITFENNLMYITVLDNNINYTFNTDSTYNFVSINKDLNKLLFKFKNFITIGNDYKYTFELSSLFSSTELNKDFSTIITNDSLTSNLYVVENTIDTFTIDINDLFEIDISENIDNNIYFEMMLFSANSQLSYNGKLVYSVDMLTSSSDINTNFGMYNITSDTYSLKYDSSIAYKSNSINSILPFIIINDGKDYDFNNTYRFKYEKEYTYNEIDNKISESAIYNGYVENIYNFAHNFIIEALSDMYSNKLNTLNTSYKELGSNRLQVKSTYASVELQILSGNIIKFVDKSTGNLILDLDSYAKKDNLSSYLLSNINTSKLTFNNFINFSTVTTSSFITLDINHTTSNKDLFINKYSLKFTKDILVIDNNYTLKYFDIFEFYNSDDDMYISINNNNFNYTFNTTSDIENEFSIGYTSGLNRIETFRVSKKNAITKVEINTNNFTLNANEGSITGIKDINTDNIDTKKVIINDAEIYYDIDNDVLKCKIGNDIYSLTNASNKD